MEKKEITVSAPVTLSDYTFFAVIETSVTCGTLAKGLVLHWSKQPMAIIIASPGLVQAFSAGGEQIALAELIRKAPEIGKLLPEYNY